MTMKQLTSEEIKEIQLEVLQEFHDFCIANNIKYSLCAGTLLGAIRHKGYIPWDDDIDVMMPRKEYFRFLKLYSSNKFSLYTYDNHSNYMLSYAKLCDNRTIITEGTSYESDYGIDIDIFPLDFFPDTIKESEKWSRHLGFLKDLREMKGMKLSSERSINKNIVVLIMRFLLLPVSMKYLVKRVDVVAQKYSYKTNGYLGNMTNGYRMKERNPMAKGLIDVEFEGRFFKAVENYDVYLKGLVNNYMQLPPVEKQVSTHTVTAYWK